MSGQGLANAKNFMRSASDQPSSPSDKGGDRAPAAPPARRRRTKFPKFPAPIFREIARDRKN
jgi:hypothetical protein